MATKIYGLLDPTCNELRYVGKTKGGLRTRLNSHINDVARGRTYIPRHKWIAGLLLVGEKPEILELEIVPDEDWQDAERFWIAYYKFVGCALLNATAGGDGIHSYRHSEETKAKQRAAALSRYQKPEEKTKTGLAVKAAYSDLAVRDKLIEARKLVPDSSYDGVRRWARSEGNRKRAREMCLARKGQPMSDEARRKLSESRKGHKRSPESIAKSAAGSRGKKRTPETRATMSLAAKLRHQKRRDELSVT